MGPPLRHVRQDAGVPRRRPAELLLDPRLSRALDALLVLVAIGLHLGAAFHAKIVPPYGNLETGLLVLPLVVQVVALGLVLALGDRTGIAVACLLQWLIVLYLLPSGLFAFNFAPCALALTLAVVRPREP